MRKEALAFPPEESTLFFINSHLIITYDKTIFRNFARQILNKQFNVRV